MRIGVAGPASLPLLAEFLPDEVIPDTYAFPWTSLLVAEYLKKGHSVDLFTSSEVIQSPTVIDANRGLRVFIGRRRQRPRARALDGFRLESADLREMMLDAAPDVIHAHWLVEFARAALDARPDALITAHDSPQVLLRHYSGPYWWIRAGLSYNTLIRAKSLTAVAPSLAQELSRLPFVNSDIDVVPNGVSAPGTLRPRTAARDTTAPVYATISNGFDQRKNTRRALEALHELRAKIPAATMVMFGAGHGPGEEAERWAQHAGVATNVVFRGVRSSRDLLAELENSVDILVHPSLWEASSIAILEAQQRGIPVIGGSRSGGVPHSLAYGQAGLLVDIGDAGAIATAMEQLVVDQQRFKQICEAAIQRCSTEFSLPNTADMYLTKLRAIADTRWDRKQNAIDRMGG